MTNTRADMTLYAEHYVPETEASQVARHASIDLGLAPVSVATAKTLTLLARLLDAKAVVEVGTGAGVSALALLAGMSRDGILTSIDNEAEHQMAAKEALREGGIAHTKYRLIAGEALSVLPRLTDSAYDLAFIDGTFIEYPEYLEEALRIVRPGGLVILHHALLGGKIADETNFDDDTMIVRDALEAAKGMDNLTTALIPVGDGLLVALKG
ncbi:MAG: O-methyltransferase [Propionibacteriaceae bacterium]|jgi:predicted O-methyltransferase YrrM|nr:O-methyltransferase [Propionibacteriaceae bacterium]